MTHTELSVLDPAGVASPSDPVARLRRQVQGSVLVPGDPDFEARCLAWNRIESHTPAVVVVAATADDVVAAVRHATEAGLGLGVQNTGHGFVVPVDGVLVDLSQLTGVRIDPDSRTAWVSGGCTWAPVLAAAQEHGLAPLLGSSSGVGAVGYTLGGGLGWLARRFGAACDAVRRYEVATPDGRLVQASEDSEPELFRALRGGGGGAFGVVTGMEIELFPVTTVYAGDLLYPAEDAAAVLDAWAAWVADVPEALTSAVVLMNYPPLEDVPEAIRGRSFAIVRGCWSGDLDEGRRLLDAWRSTMPPVVDLWEEMAFAECDRISKDPVDPMPAVTSGGWLRGVDASTAATLVEATFGSDGPPPFVFSDIRHLGGAVARGDRDATVLGHRDQPFLFHVVGAPVHHTVAELADRQAGLKAELARRTVAGGTYLNFVSHDERRRTCSDAVDPRHRAGVTDVQRRMDPDGMLRYGVVHTGEQAR